MKIEVKNGFDLHGSVELDDGREVKIRIRVDVNGWLPEAELRELEERIAEAVREA